MSVVEVASPVRGLSEYYDVSGRYLGVGIPSLEVDEEW